jgi:hypothetical protein
MDRDIASETRRFAEQHFLQRRLPLPARSPSVAAFRHAGQAAARGLGGSLGRSPLTIIVGEVT